MTRGVGSCAATRVRARVQAPRRREGRRRKHALTTEHLSLKECGAEIKKVKAEVILSLYPRCVSTTYVKGGLYCGKRETKPCAAAGTVSGTIWGLRAVTPRPGTSPWR